MNKNNAKGSSPLINMHAPWDLNENVVWLASTIRLIRNIEKFKFPNKLEKERKNHILQLTSKAVLHSSNLSGPTILKTEEMTPAEKEFLIEHFLLFEGFQETSQGAGFAVDKTGETIVIFNMKEHLQIQCTDSSGDLEKTWAKASAIENDISKDVNFAFSNKFGYLTAYPNHSGTGLLVSAFLHMPALIHEGSLADHLEKERTEGILTLGLSGSPEQFVGDIVMLQNAYTLGVNEESIISTMRNAILRLVVAEKDARSAIKASKNIHFKDLISRAIGLVRHSYQLDAQEALSALSLIKLGIELGWVRGLSVLEVNTLFFESRRSHLTYALNETAPSDDIAVRRAEYLRGKTAKLEF